MKLKESKKRRVREWKLTWNNRRKRGNQNEKRKRTRKESERKKRGERIQKRIWAITQTARVKPERTGFVFSFHSIVWFVLHLVLPKSISILLLFYAVRLLFSLLSFPFPHFSNFRKSPCEDFTVQLVNSCRKYSFLFLLITFLFVFNEYYLKCGFTIFKSFVLRFSSRLRNKRHFSKVRKILSRLEKDIFMKFCGSKLRTWVEFQ